MLRRPSIRTIRCILWPLLIAASLTPPSPSPAQDQTRGIESSATQDSLKAAYERSLFALTSPELEARKNRRRQLQQQGYGEVLHELQAGDGVSALLSWLRVMLQLEYSIPRRPLYVFVRPPETRRDTSLAGRMLPSPSGPVPLLLKEDRSFPADPWLPERSGMRR